MLKLLLDYDGTLTAEELQVPEVAARSLLELAQTTLMVSYQDVSARYRRAAQRVRTSPHEHGWVVNGRLASFADEGAFIFHTVTLQTMLTEDEGYREAVTARFAGAEYDPVAACTNHLFHAHSAPLQAEFRQGARELLSALLRNPAVEPLVVSSSLEDKVARNLARLGVGQLRVLGDTRQFEIDPDWLPPLPGGQHQVQVDGRHRIDLRRRAYHDALTQEMSDACHLAVVADTLSLPGALPLAMGIPFALLRTRYTPDWCAAYVERHPAGTLLNHLTEVHDWALQLV